MDDQIVIFKNEKIGDLIHSISSIKNIISRFPNQRINIFLSHYNSEMKFLFLKKNVKFHIISEKTNILDKLKILYFFMITNIKKTYIFKPSYFLFLLPLFFYFKRIKFYGICVNNVNYYRPSLFLRNFLERFVVNDRGTKKIRKSINDLHMNLTLNENKTNYNLAFFKKKELGEVKKEYYLFHFNKYKFSTLDWHLNDFFKIIEELENKTHKIVITNDINDEDTNSLIKKILENKKSKNITHFPNIKGENFFNLIGNAKLVISFHGMITSIAAVQNTKVLDLFNCDIKNKKDFYRYKNAFHEFKPKLNNYEFIIPKKNLDMSIKRIKNIINNGRKINY